MFRHDIEGGAKGGVATLVKDTIPAQEFTVSTNNQAEIHEVNIIVNDKQHRIFNVYSSPERDLSFDHTQLQDSKCITLGDSNRH